MTRKMQPTPAQRRVLEAMMDGVPLIHMGGFNWQQGDAKVRRSTANALYHAGWIDHGLKPQFHYVLTALGRDALTQTPTARLSVREIGRV